MDSVSMRVNTLRKTLHNKFRSSTNLEEEKFYDFDSTEHLAARRGGQGVAKYDRFVCSQSLNGELQPEIMTHKWYTREKRVASLL